MARAVWRRHSGRSQARCRIRSARHFDQRYSYSQMTSWILDFIRSTTYFGLALLTLIETVFPPIPSELIIPLGGYLARQGDLAIWGVALAAGAGSTLGAVAL